MAELTANSIMQYSIKEEIANAVSHGLGALFSVAGLVILLTMAIMEQNTLKIASFAVYGGSLVVLFLASTLYHAIYHEGAKRVLKLVDHCAIYLLIAGTYTPLLAVSLQGSLGFTMLAVIWGLALLGIVFKMKFGSKYKVISLLTYLGMGCISLFFINYLYEALSVGGFWLLAIGGLVYASGVYFYVQKKIPFNHAIWHLFVLGGAACHYFMILYYV